MLDHLLALSAPGWPEIFMIASMVGVYVVVFGFWVWMVVDCATKEPDSTTKIVWILIILLANIIGAAIYFFVRKIQRKNV